MGLASWGASAPRRQWFYVESLLELLDIGGLFDMYICMTCLEVTSTVSSTLDENRVETTWGLMQVMATIMII